jgi:hypothetical protein
MTIVNRTFCLLFLLFVTQTANALDINRLCNFTAKNSVDWIERGKALASWVNSQQPAARERALDQAKKQIKEEIAKRWAEVQDHMEKQGGDKDGTAFFVDLDLGVSSDFANYALLNPTESTLVLKKEAYDKCVYYYSKGQQRQ